MPVGPLASLVNIARVENVKSNESMEFPRGSPMGLQGCSSVNYKVGPHQLQTGYSPYKWVTVVKNPTCRSYDPTS